eukprot:c24912_g3_i1 orf=42-1442(+)
MPVVPNVGEFTVCELNRDFLVSSGEADKGAEEAYSKILGRRYPRIPYLPYQSNITGHSVSEAEVVEDDIHRSTRLTESRLSGLLAIKQLPILQQIFSQFTTGHNLDLLKKVELFQGVSWHKQRQCLAFISGGHQVCVFDFEETELRDPVTLSSECQRGVSAVAWRPNAGMTLSVACRGGVCIWMASYPGTIAPVRSGITSFLGAPSGSTGARWVLVDYIQNPSEHPVTSLTWNPSGRLLASASFYDPGFMILDVAQGTGTPLRRGFGGICLLQWSPKGDYLFSSHMDGVFRLWETESWTSEKWSSSGGPVVSAMWSSDDAVLLMAFDQTATLGALHFASKPPSLDVQLLPVDLSDLDAITGGQGRVEKMAWDLSGERLAISFSGGDEMHLGLVAVYDTRKTPILAVSLMGFIRGPESGSKALAFGFYDSLDQGLLLSVCWSTGVCCTYPMLFRNQGRLQAKFSLTL